MTTSLLLGALFNFAFFYPIIMAFFWMIGGTYYYLRRERGNPGPSSPPPLTSEPFVSLLVPCYNEAKHVGETIAAMSAQNYPDFEIIAINDGSNDNTAEALDDLTHQHPRLRVVHLEQNHGKANALRVGTLASRSDYLVCVDADAILDPNATRWMVGHLISGPRVGGVTGNPRVRNRTTLMGRMQVGEFSAIVGLIKRAQRVYGRLFTVSGVICAFRRSALHHVGFWSDNMVTEDIDISWRLQLDDWDIRYEPNALCWILMPETFRGLWMQRLGARWCGSVAEPWPPRAVLAQPTHVGRAAGIRAQPGLGLHDALYHCAVAAWQGHHAAACAVRRHHSAALAWPGAGGGVPDAVRHQSGDRAPLRKRPGAPVLLGDLVSGRLLDDRHAHCRHRLPP
ncbi:poly-beta-1,6-N-acetyl-D-glucosamine synthase [Xanthomonas arboricola]|uniref:poly-beta-1,6-N-acetyl-D-glucosamine synthase n=1 Tax=Xanthomonas arboricola TaxID=56448 RepID=UPI0026D06D71